MTYGGLSGHLVYARCGSVARMDDESTVWFLGLEVVMKAPPFLMKNTDVKHPAAHRTELLTGD